MYQKRASKLFHYDQANSLIIFRIMDVFMQDLFQFELWDLNKMFNHCSISGEMNKILNNACPITNMNVFFIHILIKNYATPLLSLYFYVECKNLFVSAA